MTTDLVHGIFGNAGIPPEIADAFGYTNRIAQAHKNYRSGAQSVVHEEDVVNAVNNFANSIGTPVWTHTTQAEVRKLRMHLLAEMPQLFANQAPPDANGHRQILSPNMSPIEASFIAITMLHVKVFSKDFQFTASELAQNQQSDPATVDAIHRQRTRMMLDTIQGRSNTVSLRDLLVAADNLLTDLKIPEISTSAIEAMPPTVGAVPTKGGL
jgi:hypothetical protein